MFVGFCFWRVVVIVLMVLVVFFVVVLLVFVDEVFDEYVLVEWYVLVVLFCM